MIRWFRTKRQLIAEAREYEAAFNALTASFARHREATKKTADIQQQTIARLDAALDRLRIARMHDRPLPWQAQDAIDQDAAAKRNEDI